MVGRRFWVVFILSFLALISPAFATTFTASITPSTINATTSTLVNVTVSNTGSANISVMTVTLPLKFAYVGLSTSPSSSNGTVTSTNTGTTSGGNTTLNWTMTMGPNQVNYFSFYVNASVIGAWNVNVTATDNASAVTSTNVALTVNDITAPQYSSNTTSPSSPSYTQGGSYTFSTYWNENINISSVIFSWNGATNYTASTTPAVTNSTSVSTGSGTYSITLTNLAAGNYTYYWWANDTSGNVNTSATFVYNITTAGNNITQTINSVTNANTIVTNSTSYTVSVSGNGTLTLYQNSTQVASNSSCAQACYLSYTFNPSTTTGLYNFTTTAAGNANYSSNSATYFVFVTPSYTLTTDAPSTYSTTVSNFNLNFTANTGATFSTELNYTGTATNYTMVQYSGTNSFNYNVSLPAGVFGRRTFLNQGTYTFLLNTTSISISQATPALSLANTLWTITYGVITNVSCTSTVSQITPLLYRNGASVTNGDYQTLQAGSYLYVCNNTATTNYTSVSVSNTLTVNPATTYAMQFTQNPTLVNVQQNATNSTIVVVKNIGTVQQQISLAITGINTSIWSVNSSASVTPGFSATFLVTFSPDSVAVGDYSGTWVATGSNGTITAPFTLHISPSAITIANLNTTFASYQAKYDDLSNSINQSKAQGLNTTAAEADLAQLKTQITSMQSYINQGDYFNAAATSASISSKISQVVADINALKPPLLPTNWPLYALIGGAAVVVIFVIYLFLPSRNVQPTVQPIRKSLSDLQDKMKKKEFKYDYGKENG